MNGEEYLFVIIPSIQMDSKSLNPALGKEAGEGEKKDREREIKQNDLKKKSGRFEPTTPAKP